MEADKFNALVEENSKKIITQISDVFSLIALQQESPLDSYVIGACSQSVATYALSTMIAMGRPHGKEFIQERLNQIIKEASDMVNQCYGEISDETE